MMYMFYLMPGLAPFLVQFCAANYYYKQGEICNFNDHQVPVVKYDKPKPEDGCYRDGIFYPRCKDLDNPEVLYYHNLFK